MITVEQFKKLFPEAKQPQDIVDELNHFMSLYGITNEAAFISQCGHESQGFTRYSENLNYSAEALIKTWPTRFNASNAAQYARQPEKIANKVYADRLGNGNETSGDGWKYRGAGFIQLTGKTNQEAFAKATGISLDDASAYLHGISGAVESACWFWRSRGLTEYADNIKRISIRINGGTIGLNDRLALFEKVSGVMA